MRLLVAIVHYCGPRAGESKETFGSQLQALPRIAALSEMIVALNRHFGTHRNIGPMGHLAGGLPKGRALDIVIVTIKDRNILEFLAVDEKTVTVEECTCEPLMLSFETQRVIRERLGHYDLYATMEDDLIIHDPAFLDKIVWFQETFGPDTALMPHRFEMSKSRTLSKLYIEPPFKSHHAEFRRRDAKLKLEGTYRGARQSFELPTNPHSGCAFVTDAQLRHWVKQPTFYDRNASWVGPLESAATRSFAATFDVYKPAEPDIAFCELEHYGIRGGARYAPPGEAYGEAPLLMMAQAAYADVAASNGISLGSGNELTDLREEAAKLRGIVKSHKRMAVQMARLIVNKKRWRNPAKPGR